MPGPIPDAEAQNTRDKRPVASTDGVIPEAPSWLNAEAKKIFKDAAKKAVENLGIASSADTMALSIYSMQCARLQELYKVKDRDLRQEKLLNDLVSSVSSFAKELGLSPGGRARMRIVQKNEDTPEDTFFH